MKLVLLVVTVATIVGLISGGRFRYFPSIPLGWWSLAIAGVILQFVPVGGDAGYWALLGSFVLLLAFAASNVRAPGFILILTGLFLNTIVIVLRGRDRQDQDEPRSSGSRSKLDDTANSAPVSGVAADPERTAG